MQKQCFEIFCDEVSRDTQQKQLAMILDRASAHTSATIVENIKLIHLPPACPELNPAERFFKELRKELKIRVFLSLEHIENKIRSILDKYFKNPDKVINITSFPYIFNA